MAGPLGSLLPGPAYWVQNPERLGPAWRRRLARACGEGTLLLRHRLGRGGEPLPVPPGLASAWSGTGLTLPSDSPLAGVALGLVLDGALALESSDGPLWGPRAVRRLGLALPPGVAQGASMKASCLALQMVAQAPRPELDRLTAGLYYFGRTPLSGAIRQRLPDSEAVGRFLGIAGVGREPEVARRFRAIECDSSWFYWRSPQPRPGSKQWKWKLYVCLPREALADRMPAIATTLAAGDTLAFKLAASAHGLCRPDHMVAYFPTEAALRASAEALIPLLLDAPAVPLPFTVALEPEGRLSFGCDPARDSLAWIEGQSWRLWLCGRLARALAAAREAPEEGLPAWRFALLRAALLGLDPASFGPLQGMPHEA